MKKIALLLLILIACESAIYAQYDEKQILTQQANQLLIQRQYAQAEQLFLQILDKYPNDLNSINQLMNLYFTLSQTDKAETTLKKYQRILPPQTYSEFYIQLLVTQAKVDDAWQEAMRHLANFGYDEFKFRRLASFFERKAFYDKVMELYTMARNRLGKPDLFRLEMANTALNCRQFEKAIREYMAYTESNPVYLFFTNNQLKTILQEEPSLISVVSAIADSSKSSVLKELYANALVNMKDYKTALSIYKQLDPQKMWHFAEDQAAVGNDSIAFEAYSYLENIETDQVKKMDLLFRMAELKYQQRDYPGSEQIISGCLSMPFWKDRNLYYRSNVSVKLRKLMAEIMLAKNEPVDSALVWLNEAKKFSRNNLEAQEMDLEIARLYILNSEKEKADNILKTINYNTLMETRSYLNFLNTFLAGETALADTLMNEFIIRYPESKYTNDAIYLMMFTLNMDEQDRSTFYSAVRLLQLNHPSGIDSLEVIFKHNKDEEILLLAIEWAIAFGDETRAAALLQYDFQDEIASDYAALLRLLLVADRDEEQRMAKEFLKNKPNSVFSPDFRKKISRWATSKPNI
ncbi:MAG TPA: tetratricopeptide repeat protein [Candidatus Cloacimonas sp.]|jgi:TolA-binding protein|nr:tetratricopeptide repeat protein [Candidatus Cloacimonas sp.]MDD2249962.1 tetratricopeptide repeat protein [Candidatus Cloacimonadota bacterium]MDD3869250.1 tetratricopeptide repeat protein [Candidatus Cloacimonadota bacterium]MDD4677134.1 tetratricopeptide repeat protein [Candidatus Cloacimonadota bacterium]HOQ77600.1 tetratricopeptide repeat protein [Candidatus Cloacimonas sp.]